MRKKIFWLTGCASITTTFALFGASKIDWNDGNRVVGKQTVARRFGKGLAANRYQDTCNMHDAVNIGTGTNIPSRVNGGNGNMENNPGKQLSGAGLTSVRQFGYGVYAVTMLPNSSPGAVSSFYIYDNLVTVKGIKSHDEPCRTWRPGQIVYPASATKDQILQYTKSIGESSLDNPAPPNGTVCAFPSYWREIDIEFVPGYNIQNYPALNHFQASGENCVGPQTLGSSCQINQATTGLGQISFNTFNIDDVKTWEIQNNGGTNYLVPKFAGTQNNSNLQVFYPGTQEAFVKPRTYFFYYLPNGAFFTTDLSPNAYDFNSAGLIANTWPAPIFGKTDSTDVENLDPLAGKNPESAKPYAFRYNADAFNKSFTADGKTALMNISVNVWDGALSANDYWSGAHSPEQYSYSKYWKIAYYPLDLSTFDKNVSPQKQTYLPSEFYSDFSNNKFCEKGNPTMFSNMWAVHSNPGGWWQSYDFYFRDLFANTYIWPLGGFRNANIICDKDHSLALTIGASTDGKDLFEGGNFDEDFKNCGYDE